jgi:hypothetical protein
MGETIQADNLRLLEDTSHAEFARGASAFDRFDDRVDATESGVRTVLDAPGAARAQLAASSSESERFYNRNTDL